MVFDFAGLKTEYNLILYTCKIKNLFIQISPFFGDPPAALR